MSSMLRLPSLDRPSLGLTKRFSLLSTNTLSSTRDDPASSLVSLRTLPSIECLDSDDFLDMFESRDDRTQASDTEHSCEREARPIVSELSGTPKAAKLSEQHGVSISQRDLSMKRTRHFQFDNPRPTKLAQEDRKPIDYRSSVSSSNQSTNRSNASSYRSRTSSKSSMTEDCSSSEQSIHGARKRSALHERLKRRSHEKRVSLSRLAQEPASLESHEGPRSTSEILPSGSRCSRHEIPPSMQSSLPSSRGERLGKVMSGSLLGNPPLSPVSSDRQSQQHPSPRPVSNAFRLRKDSSSSSQTRKSSRTLLVPPVDDVDRIRVGIMSQLDNVADLRSCAQVSKDFYLTFQKYETLLVDCVLHQHSIAMWELRYSVRHIEKPSPFRLRSVLRDISTISALEDFIVWRCQSILRPQTLNAFLGDDPRRKTELEDALWIIWTFCNVFGKTSMSDATLIKQIQWLNGVADYDTVAASSKKISRTTPCTKKQLENISEVWRCLEMLLSGFKGREDEARQAGIFDNAGSSKLKDRELLNAWIHDILSLGPKAVLTLSSCDFEQAKVLGVTRWIPPSKGRSRSNFLKAAVEEVYRDRLMEEARQKASDYRKSVQTNHKRTQSDPALTDPTVARPPIPQSNRHSILGVENSTSSRQSVPPQPLNAARPQPMEIRPDCDPLSSASASQPLVVSPSTNPGIFSPLAITTNASTRLGATLFPMQNRDQSYRLSIPLDSILNPSDSSCASLPDVVDPADKAVTLLVQEMGFSESETKRALAQSDTGSGIDVQRAIEILSSDLPFEVPSRRSQISELPAAAENAQLAPKKSKREVCEGHCKPLLLVEPRRERVSGLGMVKRGLSHKMNFRKSVRLSTIVDDEDLKQVIPGPELEETGISGTDRNSAVSQLANSAITAFTVPLLSHIGTFTKHDALDSVMEQSPASPTTPPAARDWLGPEGNPLTVNRSRQEEGIALQKMPKPRITLQRVGTGVKKQAFTLPGRKKKERIVQPEIIGYVY